MDWCIPSGLPLHPYPAGCRLTRQVAGGSVPATAGLIRCAFLGSAGAPVPCPATRSGVMAAPGFLSARPGLLLGADTHRRCETSYRVFVRMVATLGVLLLVFAVPGLAQTPKKGGVIRVGILGEPPALDPHWTTASLTETLSNHIFEGLYSFDENYRPIPMLAEGMPAVSTDGLTYTFKLRQGIKFHNGKEMTSEDVVASLKRWSQQSIRGKSLFAAVEDLRAADKYTVEMKFKQKSPLVLISLAAATNFGAIYPKEIAEKFAPRSRPPSTSARAPSSWPSGSRISTSGWFASTIISR